jgi:antitoxin ChpS
MVTTTSRKIVGSDILAVPPAFLEALNIKTGTTVGIEIQGECLVITALRPRYTLEELLAQCDPAIPWSAEDREWIEDAPAGAELIRCGVARYGLWTLNRTRATRCGAVGRSW